MRSKLILAAALIMGLLTTVLFFDYMKRFDHTSVEAGTTVSIVAVKQAVKENTKLTEGMLQLVEVPASAVHAEAIRNPADAVGKITASDLAAGETVLLHHLRSQQEEALFVSRKVQDGYRAVSIGVNLVQSVSNLLEPGDYVDILSTLTDKQQGEHLTTQVLLENIRVLAVGRRMIEATRDTPYVEYSTVTVEVKPGDAVNLVNADERGNLSLSLHGRVEEAKTQ